MDYICTKDPATGDVVELYGRVKHRFATSKAEICLIETADFGEVLIMNNEIQSSSRDERIYHSALVGPAIRGCEERVVILGGGEGCTAREVLARAPQAQIEQYDYDCEAVEWARSALRHWNEGAYESDRVHLHFENAWVADLPQADAFIIDIFDITADTAASYLELLERAICHLRPNGRVTAYLGDKSEELEEFVCRVSQMTSAADCLVRSYIANIPSYGGAESLFLYLERKIHPLPVPQPDLVENKCNPVLDERP
jgi:spermidine synthase